MSAELHDLLKLLSQHQSSASHYAEMSVSDEDASNRATFACLAANAVRSATLVQRQLKSLGGAR
jgi:hypothetical protein